MKLIKIAGLALVGLVLVAVLVLMFGIPGQPLMGYIEDQAAKAGYQLRVDGASKVSLWPNLNVSASDIRLSDPDDPRDNLLTAKELRIGISLLSLLTGDVRIHEIEVTRPVVRLTSGRRGSRVAGRRETREDSARNIAIDRLSVVDGTLIMRDLRENLEGRLDAIQLTASAPADGPVDLKLDGKTGDQLLRLAAKANSLRQIIDGRPTPVEATIELPGIVKGPLSLIANFRATDRVIGIDGIRGQLSSGRVSGAVAIDTSGAKPAANANSEFRPHRAPPGPGFATGSTQRAVEQSADGSCGASRLRHGGEGVGARARGRHHSHRPGRDRGEPVGRAVVVGGHPLGPLWRSHAGPSRRRCSEPRCALRPHP